MIPGKKFALASSYELNICALYNWVKQNSCDREGEKEMIKCNRCGTIPNKDEKIIWKYQLPIFEVIEMTVLRVEALS